MVDKFYGVIFSSIVFCSCTYDPTIPRRSGNLPTQFLPATGIYQWEADINFRPSDNHPWGFDRHVNPKNDADRRVHISVSSGEKGFVNIHRNFDIDAGYSYYICENGDVAQNIWNIDDSHLEDVSEMDIEYVISSASENEIRTVGLCRDYGGNQKLVKSLDVHTYAKKNFDVTVLQVGYDDFVEETKYLNQGKSFWNVDFAKALNQAVINVRYRYEKIRLSDNVSDSEKGDYYTEIDGSFLSVKAEHYGSSCYQEIDDDLDLLESELVNAFLENDFSKIDKRVIVGLGIPTRKFWTFKKNLDGGIEPCVEDVLDSEQPQPNVVYDLGMIYSMDRDCEITECKLRWHFGTNWDVSFDNGMSWKNYDDLNIREDIIDPKCNVLMEEKQQLSYSKGGSNQYLKSHFPSNARAETKYISQNGEYVGAVSYNPYTENDYRFVLHELVHLLGLVDVEDLDGLGFSDLKSSEGNLMFKSEQNGVKLRNRPMQSKNGDSYENQWDCLHRLSEESCADPEMWRID